MRTHSLTTYSKTLINFSFNSCLHTHTHTHMLCDYILLSIRTCVCVGKKVCKSIDWPTQLVAQYCWHINLMTWKLKQKQKQTKTKKKILNDKVQIHRRPTAFNYRVGYGLIWFCFNRRLGFIWGEEVILGALYLNRERGHGGNKIQIPHQNYFWVFC